MSEWEISVPLGAPGERLDLGAMADATRDLPAEDAAVARQLALMAACDPDIHTYGDLRRKLEAAGEAGRREVLDRAREGAGLPSASKVDADRAFRAAQPPPSPNALRDAQGRIEARCSEAGCGRFEPHPAGISGAAALVSCKRWYCEEHRTGHETDLEPYTGPRLTYGPGGIVDLDEQEREAKRARVEAESRRRQREARDAQARADGERYAELEEAAHRRFLSELPAGFRP